MAAELARPRENRILGLCLRARRVHVLAAAVALAILVGALDWRIGLEVSLGAFYVFPIILAATVLRRAHIALATVMCAVLRVTFNPAPTWLEVILGFSMASMAYTGAGLFVAELVRNRHLVLGYADRLREQQALRKEVEEQLELLVESSPAAIMTIDGSGRVLAANRAAHDLLAFGNGSQLLGEHIGSYLPLLSDALTLDAGPHGFRTAAQCRGRRRTGQHFIAHTWFSTYPAGGERRLAAIAVDSSEEIRDREEQNLQQLLRSNRIVAGAVSHDIRNLCGAVGVIYSNLRRVNGLERTEDFQALGTLIDGLGKIASADLRSRTREDIAAIDLSAVLEHLRIVIEPAWDEIDGQVEWAMPAGPLAVFAEPTGLLQAFLNLAHNSHRAVQGSPARRLSVSVHQVQERVTISFRDSGPGVAEPGKLFQPFQPGAEASGLGLYVSRAILRTFGGELRHVPAESGCRFDVELQPAPRMEPR